MSFINTARLALLLGLTALVIACSDLLVNPAPVTSRSFALSLHYAPQVSDPGSQIDAFSRADSARIFVTQGETLIADTTVAFAGENEEARLRLELEARFASAPITVLVELRAGGLILFRGFSSVTLSEGGTTSVEVPIQPVATTLSLAALTAPIQAIGGSAQLQATALFATGDTIRDAAIVWRSLRPEIVEVSTAGLVTALGEGEARIEATLNESADTAVVVVQAVVTRVTVEPPASALVIGQTAPAIAHAEDSNGNRLNRSIIWSSSDSSVVDFTAGSAELRAVAAGSAEITATADGVSGSATIAVLNPAPVLLSLDPAGVPAGSGPRVLVLRGTGFVAASRAFFAGETRPVELVGPTELRIFLTAEDLGTPGAFPIHVENVGDGGGTSETVTLQVVSPTPVLLALSPAQVVAGQEEPLTLTVTGSGFLPGSSVRWLGRALPTEYVSTTELRAEIPPADLASPGGALISVFNPEPGGGTSAELFFTIASPGPVVAALVPDSTLVDTGSLTLSVRGQGFAPTSIVRWDGADRPTEFFSATELRAAIPAADLDEVRVAQITVFSPAPGGGTSAALAFTVYNPAPSVTTINPDTVVAGSEGITLIVRGEDFVAASVVQVDGANRATTYISPAELRATVPAADLAEAGTLDVSVLSPSPGGGSSNVLELTVANPTPMLVALSPDTVPAGAGATVVMLLGVDFVPTSIVRVGESTWATEYVSATELRATAPAGALAEATTIELAVFNPAPGGGTSGSLELTVANPIPAIDALVPEVVPVGGEGAVVSVQGSGFVATSTVFVGDSERPTEYIAEDELQVTLSAGDVAESGAVDVVVVNPGPGGGSSGPATLTIANPEPAITTLAPDTIPVGSETTTVAVLGSGFVPTSTIIVGESERATEYVSDSELRFTLTGDELTRATAFAVSVFNPAPGGGSSASADLTIANPAPVLTSVSPDTVETFSEGSITLTILGADFVPDSEVRLDGLPLPTEFVETNHLGATLSSQYTAEPAEFAVTVFTPGPGGGTSSALDFVVEQPPFIELSPQTISFVAVAGDSLIPVQTVDVTNGGGGSLTGMEVSVELLQEAPEWLVGSLDSSSAPAVLTLQANARELRPGSYSALVSVYASEAENSPQQVQVSITVSSGFSFWRADGDYLDSGDAGNDARPVGSVALSPSGFIGGAFEFSGPAGGGGPNEITASDIGGGLATTNEVTLATWVQLAPSQPDSIVARFVTLQPERAVLRLDGRFGEGVDDSLHFYISTSSGAVGLYAYGVLWQRQCWYHVAATWDGQMARLYLNGEEWENTAWDGTLNPGNGEGIKLSNYDTNGIESLHGLLDEVRVYPRAAGPDEIAAWADPGASELVCQMEQAE